MAESLSMRGVHDASQGPESVRRTSGENDASPRTMEQPSEGGLVGWLQVAGSFALYFNHLGMLSSYGAFQFYYETEMLKGSSPSAISWIGSIQIFCFMAIAVVIGPLFDMGYCRALIATGAALETGGFMLASISTQYWQILLTQGICVGLGTCCLSIPSMAVIPRYFFKRRALAMATATVGSGLGATLYPLIFQRLQRQTGFPWAMRVIGFLTLAMCLFALAVMKPRRNPEKPAWQVGGFSWRWFIDLSAFRERSYLVYCAAIFFNNLAFFIPSYYAQSYALVHGMDGVQLAGYLLSIMNASTIPGRIIPSYIADKIGSLDTYVVVCTLSSASIFYWTSVTNTAGNIAFAIMWGFFSGAVVALATVVLAGITPDLSRLGTRLGMVSILKGIGSLIGPPISGAILSGTGSYLGVQLFAAFGMMLTSVLMLALRVVLARQALRPATVTPGTANSHDEDGRKAPTAS